MCEAVSFVLHMNFTSLWIIFFPFPALMFLLVLLITVFRQCFSVDAQHSLDIQLCSRVCLSYLYYLLYMIFLSISFKNYETIMYHAVIHTKTTRLFVWISTVARENNVYLSFLKSDNYILPCTFLFLFLIFALCSDYTFKNWCKNAWQEK